MSKNRFVRAIVGVSTLIVVYGPYASSEHALSQWLPWWPIALLLALASFFVAMQAWTLLLRVVFHLVIMVVIRLAPDGKLSRLSSFGDDARPEWVYGLRSARIVSFCYCSSLAVVALALVVGVLHAAALGNSLAAFVSLGSLAPLYGIYLLVTSPVIQAYHLYRWEKSMKKM